MGGTELLLVMKLGLATPAHLVDCKGLSELSGLEVDDRYIRIGAATTHRALELDEELRRVVPALPAMAREVANVRVRNAGTLGGNLCFGEPHSDPAALLIAMGAIVQLVSPRQARELPLEEFFLGPLMTALEPAEILLRIYVPRPPHDAAVMYRRLAFRERPVVTVAAVAGDGLQLVVGAVGARPIRVGDEQLPVPSTVAQVREIATFAAETVDPIPDADGSVGYKRHLTGVMVERALLGLEGMS
jgi:aerobic carbon-monoxide dehydrogenase medium subunit